MLYHVVRIGANPLDTFASTDRAEAIGMAMPDADDMVECATVEAPDAGAARLMIPEGGWRSCSPFWRPALPETYVFAGAFPDSKPQISVRTPRRWLTIIPALLLTLSAPAFAAPAPCQVNVTTCNVVSCAFLPGIGQAKGAAIAQAHPKTEEELDAVPGIGVKTLEALRPFVTYGTAAPTTCTAKQSKDGAK